MARLASDVKLAALHIPKFRLEANYDLAETLEKMGIPLPFTKAANFSAISSSIFISTAAHKAFVEMN